MIQVPAALPSPRLLAHAALAAPSNAMDRFPTGAAFCVRMASPPGGETNAFVARYQAAPDAAASLLRGPEAELTDKRTPFDVRARCEAALVRPEQPRSIVFDTGGIHMLDSAVTAKRSLQALPLSDALGAELRGVDIQEDMSPEEVGYIHRMLLQHRVVFLRNQHHVTDTLHRAFARHFGEIVDHPTVATQADPGILELHSHRGGRANSWHTDVTFDLRPPKISILRAVTLPPMGGDTVWANTVAAYHRLPDHLRALADRLWAVHGNDFDYAASRVELLHDEAARRYRRQYAAEVIKSEHPVTCVHPETGERSLMLGHYAQRFVHFNTHDSTRLYEIFQAHITRLENTIRWRWAPGDVALWDNRATQHYAINDYGNHARVMRRITLVGEVPEGVDGSRSRVHER